MYLQLKIQIKGISKPPVWREVFVPADYTFDALHKVILRSFGWGGGHLYAFTPNGVGSRPSIEQAIDDYGYKSEEADMDSRKTKLSKFLGTAGVKFSYTYDFGDDWEHTILVKAVKQGKINHAELIGGKGKCPPDDCGGVWGYKDLLDTISNPKHPDYASMREWLGLENGETWDTHQFDLENTAKHVR